MLSYRCLTVVTFSFFFRTQPNTHGPNVPFFRLSNVSFYSVPERRYVFSVLAFCLSSVPEILSIFGSRIFLLFFGSRILPIFLVSRLLAFLLRSPNVAFFRFPDICFFFDSVLCKSCWLSKNTRGGPYVEIKQDICCTAAVSGAGSGREEDNWLSEEEGNRLIFPLFQSGAGAGGVYSSHARP